MNYYRLNQIPRENPAYGFAAYPPEGTEAFTYRMAKGKPVADRFPPDAKVELEEGGVELPSFIGNTDSFFIVSKPVKEVIEQAEVGEVEYLPLAVVDYKERLLDENYFIVNPIDTFDALDLEASEIKYFNGKVVAVKTFVLDPEKLTSAPDLFRVPEAPSEYFLSQRLALALKEIGATNIYLHEVEQSPAKLRAS